MLESLTPGHGTGSEADDGGPVVVNEPRPQQDPQPGSGGDPEQPPANTDPAPTEEERVAAAIALADAALAEADYADAILAYNQALPIKPGDPELRQLFETAAENYRVQQAKQERWNQALKDFDNGNYREALAYFYRLPEEEQTGDVARYMRDGWYNLGVTALKGRQCTEALEHLDEARRLDAGDAGVLEAADMAIRCRREGAAVIRSAALALQYRGLNDSP